jgi:hypothetical protein
MPTTQSIFLFISMTQTFSFSVWKFLIDKKPGELFLFLHAKRIKIISLFPSSQNKGERNLIGIDTAVKFEV